MRNLHGNIPQGLSTPVTVQMVPQEAPAPAAQMAQGPPMPSMPGPQRDAWKIKVFFFGELFFNDRRVFSVLVMFDLIMFDTLIEVLSLHMQFE